MRCKSVCSFLAGIAASALLFVSCKKDEPLVLWTNSVEFVSYAELYNSVQDGAKIVALYTKTPEKELTSLDAKTGRRPDIIAGSYLQSGMQKKYFSNLNSLIKENGPVDCGDIYESLLQTGRLNEKQYLLPVSFNLPALVFHASNYENLEENTTLSFDAIKSISKKYNAQNKNGSYTAMGFGPLWSPEFLYLVFKTGGIFFNASPTSITYSENAFMNSASFVQDWVNSVNGNAENEQDFAFKYLYMPFYNQVQSGRCLFSYATSDQIMSLSKDQISDLDFRWICNDNKIQVEDNLVMMGIYSKSKNKDAAKKFIAWFMNSDSQKKMLDRKVKMELGTSTFGIAGGFSSLHSVNERFFPTYYRSLLSNTPVASFLVAPQNYPADWATIKAHVVEPFIADYTASSGKGIKSLSQRYAEFVAAENGARN